MSDTSRQITAFEARTHLGEMMDFIRYSKQPCFIERHGKVVAALVDIESYQQLTLPQKYQRWLDEAVQLIKTHYQPEKIILFGSMAQGKCREGSDIDLLILKNTSLPLHKRIEEVLKILPLESPVEPHVYTPQEIDDRLKEGDPFLTNAFQKGTVLYES